MSFDFSGTWIRPTPQGIERMRADYEDTAVDCGGGWYRIDFGTASVGQNIPAGTIGCSRAYGESVFLRVSAIVTVFELAHADAGTLRRHIQYVDGSWIIVDGAPQPWEPQLLYPSAQLQKWRQWATADANQQQLDELDALERTQAIARGAFNPMPSVEKLAMALARHFGFKLVLD